MPDDKQALIEQAKTRGDVEHLSRWLEDDLTRVQGQALELMARTALGLLLRTVERLDDVERRLDGALASAYANYDPIKDQLSEVRREIAGLREALPARRGRGALGRLARQYDTLVSHSHTGDLLVTVVHERYGTLSDKIPAHELEDMNPPRGSLADFAEGALRDKVEGVAANLFEMLKMREATQS